MCGEMASEPLDGVRADRARYPAPAERCASLRPKGEKDRAQRFTRRSPRGGGPQQSRFARPTGGRGRRARAHSAESGTGNQRALVAGCAEVGSGRHSSRVARLAFSAPSSETTVFGTPRLSRLLFTSESVTEGHPDKVADQISDAVLDAILAGDPHARVACETMVTTGLATIFGRDHHGHLRRHGAHARAGDHRAHRLHRVRRTDSIAKTVRGDDVHRRGNRPTSRRAWTPAARATRA